MQRLWRIAADSGRAYHPPCPQCRGLPKRTDGVTFEITLPLAHCTFNSRSLISARLKPWK